MLETYDTDMAFLSEKVHQLKFTLKEKAAELHAAQKEVELKQAMLSEQLTAKDSTAASLSQVRMQIQAMPVPADQSNYFEGKVSALGAEIDAMQQHLDQSTALKDTITRQVRRHQWNLRKSASWRIMFV